MSTLSTGPEPGARAHALGCLLKFQALQAQNRRHVQLHGREQGPSLLKDLALVLDLPRVRDLGHRGPYPAAYSTRAATRAGMV